LEFDGYTLFKNIFFTLILSPGGDMSYKAACAVMVFLFGFIGLSFGQEKTVTITTLVDFAPYCFTKKDAVEKSSELILPGSDSSQLQGYSWDVVRESFQEMGYTIILKIAPWSRAMNYVQKGKADVIFPAIKTIKREKIFYYSKTAVDETNIVIYFSDDSKIKMPKGLESLKNRSIAHVRGWAYGKKWEADRGIIKESTDSILQSFKMLDKKYVVGVVGYENAFDCKLQTTKIFNQYKKSNAIDHVADYLIGKKGNTASIDLVNDFDFGKKKIAANGILDEINKKWKWIHP
jgi:ABC-type amino acid transport substrate-binding protein